MSTWLITGGAGFIGANFVFYLKKQYPYDRIIVLDKLTYAGNINTLSPLMEQKNFRFIKGDIADRKKVEQIFSEEHPDYLINFAAESHVDRSINDPSPFLTTNILGTSVLMDVCNQYGIRRFHQISTDEVYGDLPLEKSALLFTEKSPLLPSSPYSASKASADLLVLSYRRTYGLPVSISRCSNNFGPFQFPEKLIPRMIIRGIRKQTLPIFGDGKDSRDWLFVEDHCRAIDCILQNGKEGEIYNIGGGNEWENLTLVKKLCELIEAPEKIRHTPDRKGHDLRYGVDCTKIHALGWKPETNFEDKLFYTVNWYKENEKWWSPLLMRDFWPEWAEVFKEKG